MWGSYEAILVAYKDTRFFLIRDRARVGSTAPHDWVQVNL